jgi:hypothetical protein
MTLLYVTMLWPWKRALPKCRSDATVSTAAMEPAVLGKLALWPHQKFTNRSTAMWDDLLQNLTQAMLLDGLPAAFQMLETEFLRLHVLFTYHKALYKRCVGAN